MRKQPEQSFSTRDAAPPIQMWRHPSSAQAAPGSSWTRAAFSFRSITRPRLIKEAARRSLLMMSLWSVHTSGCSPAFPTPVVSLRRKVRSANRARLRLTSLGVFSSLLYFPPRSRSSRAHFLCASAPRAFISFAARFSIHARDTACSFSRVRYCSLLLLLPAAG